MRKILVAIAATVCLSTAAFAEEQVSTEVPPKGVPPKAESITPPNYHQANWNGGHGASWQVGRHTYGFEGFFHGCHYTGHAGPHGYHLDKVC
jgi:hypothetical protein